MPPPPTPGMFSDLKSGVHRIKQKIHKLIPLINLTNIAAVENCELTEIYVLNMYPKIATYSQSVAVNILNNTIINRSSYILFLFYS